MQYLNAFDYIVMVVYCLILLGIGFYLKEKASQNLREYYLAGNKMPWWAMGISGMAFYLDVTGTMLIVSFLYLLGPRGLYVEFRGGVCLLLAFMMVWAGKYHYRSKCITGAEWMEYRFGSDWGGQFARIVSAIAFIIGTIGSLAYLIKGIGIFLSMYMPFSPLTCSLILIGVATIYTIFSGFYGVVFTDIFQSVIIFIGIFTISIMAITKIVDVPSFVALTEKVTGNTQWMSSALPIQTTMPRGYEAYQHLLLFTFFYFLRSVVGGVAEGANQKYFGARNERECGSLTFLWTFLLMFRWPLMISFAVLGIYLVNDLFPHQAVLLQAADLIKSYVVSATPERWQDILSGIINSSGQYPQELIQGLKTLLGGDWQNKLYLVSYNGTVNPECIVPAVILFNIPIGLRGLLLTAMVAACMSTFSTQVNQAASYFVRDIYQRYWRPKSSNRELIFSSYLFTFIVVLFSYFMAYTVKSINDIWGWMIMGLSIGAIIPAMFKFYWWRFNGKGFAIGTIVGLVGAFIQRGFWPDMVEWQQFTILSTICLIATIVGTMMTQPTDEKVMEHFYATTRPFGFWAPLKRKLKPSVREAMEREHKNDLIALPFALVWQVSIFFLPMQWIIRAYDSFYYTLIIFVISSIGLYWFWYRNLPKKGQAFSDKHSEETESIFLS